MVPQRSFSVTLNAGSKYYPFLVPDEELAGVLSGIYDAVKTGQSGYTLPSDAAVDLSGLELKPIDALSLPSTANYKKAREFFLLRQQWLPGVDFKRPSTSSGHVEVGEKGVRVSDRVADSYMGTVRYRVDVSRNRRPFEEGDYDALWVYHPDRVHFWLIPAHVLVEKGVMASPRQLGKVTLYLYDDSYVEPGRASRKPAGLWSQDYVYSSQDPELSEKVWRALEDARS
jgi:hypothetical protein